MAQGTLRSNKSRDGLAAILAYNLGDLEEDLYDVRQEWLAQHAEFDDMQVALEEAGLRVLNRPNLLQQNWSTTGTGVDHAVIYGQDSRIGGTTYPYLKSYNSPTLYELQQAATAEQKAAATSYWEYTEEGVTHYNLYMDEDDIRATVATLAAADQITEPDGEVYDKAIQFDITANPAYENAEWLMYYNPNFQRQYVQGATNVKNYGQIEEMTPGETYTISFWARVLSGDGAICRFGYGNSYTNAPYNDTTNYRSGLSDWMDISGASWKRYSWSFEFNPVGDWYTETSTTENGVTTITRSYNWYKKVCFGFGRKHTAVIQVCGFRMVRGKLFICETYDDLAEGLATVRRRVTTLETASAATPAAISAAKAAVLANIAMEESTTATANHVVGALFVMGDVLYKTTAAIAIGETITPGTNCDTTTLAAEIEAAAASTPDLSAYAPKASPAFTGSISMGRQAETTVGLRSVAVGNNAAATGNYSGAIGNYTVAGGNGAVAVGNKSEASGNNSFASGEQTIANHRSQVAFGEYNIQDPNTTYTGRGTYAEIVGNGTSNSARSNARTLDWNGNEWIAGNLTLGNTTLTEAQLQALLALIS